MIILQKIVWFVIALGVLIVVHEYGHYLVARLCGVKVLRFSVGFGRRLLSHRFGPDRTEWTIAAVPLGGYVKMLDEREGEVAEHELPRAFNRQSVGKRFAIVAAGPLFNFIFAALAYTVLFMHGMPEARPVIAEPAAGTQAQRAGFHAGEIVRAVDGIPVTTWSEVRWRVVRAAIERRAVEVDVADDKDRLVHRRLDLSSLGDDVEKDVASLSGLTLLPPTFEPVVGEVLPGSAAEKAALKPGDRIVRIDGRPISTWQEFVRAVQQSPGRPLAIVVERGELTLETEIVPQSEERGGKAVGKVGIAVRDSGRFFTTIRRGPLDSFGKGVAQTWDVSAFTLETLAKMVIGQVSWKHISGPITIADIAGQSAQLGWIAFVQFLAIVSIGLGVLNLLPVPLLDGGHLMYYAIEVVKGKPVSERAIELGQRVGLALLLVMMAFAFYNDLNRLLTG